MKEKRVIRGSRIVPGHASGRAVVSETALYSRSEFDSDRQTVRVYARIPVIQVEAADLNWIADGDWVEVDSDRQTVRVYEPQ